MRSVPMTASSFQTTTPVSWRFIFQTVQQKFIITHPLLVLYLGEGGGWKVAEWLAYWAPPTLKMSFCV